MFSQIATVGQLFTQSFRTVRVRKNVFLYGALIFSLMNVLMQSLLNAADYLFSHQPSVTLMLATFLLLIVIVAMMFLNVLYYLITVLEKESTVRHSLRHAFSVFPRMYGLAFCVCMRSFVWICFLGFLISFAGKNYELLAYIVTAVGLIMTALRLPVFLLAPILLLSGESVRTSMEMSIARTRGHWQDIISHTTIMIVALFSAFFLIGLVFFALLSLPSILGIPFSEMVTLLGIFLLLAFLIYLNQLLLGYATAFMVALADSVIAHPKKT